MVNFLQGLVVFLTGTIQMGVQGAFVLVIFNRKLNWNRLLFFSLITGALSQISRLLPLLYSPILNLCVYVVLIPICLKIIFEFRILQSILAVCLTILMSTFAQYVLVAVAKISLQEKANLWLSSKAFHVVIMKQGVATLFIFVVLSIILYIKFKISIPDDIDKRKMISILVNAIITVTVIVPNMIIMYSTHFTASTNIIVFNSASLLTMFVLSLFNSLKYGELELKKQEVEFQKQYINTLNDLIDGLRGFKHDYNNMVQVIGGYLSLNDLEGLKKYHFQMKGESTYINNVIPLNTYIKENPPLYGLILSKFTYSEVKNVIFQSNILTNVDIANIKIYDFCKVLGILLDNAIEAAAESNKRYVEFNIMQNRNKSGLIIEISNSFSEQVDIENIYKNGYTTKKDHSGFGLWEVKKILGKYKNCSIQTKVYADSFVQYLEIMY